MSEGKTTIKGNEYFYKDVFLPNSLTKKRVYGKTVWELEEKISKLSASGEKKPDPLRDDLSQKTLYETASFLLLSGCPATEYFEMQGKLETYLRSTEVGKKKTADITPSDLNSLPENLALAILEKGRQYGLFECTFSDI